MMHQHSTGIDKLLQRIENFLRAMKLNLTLSNYSTTKWRDNATAYAMHHECEHVQIKCGTTLVSYVAYLASDRCFTF